MSDADPLQAMREGAPAATTTGAAGGTGAGAGTPGGGPGEATRAANAARASQGREPYAAPGTRPRGGADATPAQRPPE